MCQPSHGDVLTCHGSAGARWVLPLLQAVIPQKSSRTMHRRCGRARVNKVEFSLHPSPVKSA